MGIGNGVSAKEIRAKVAQTSNGPVYQGTYKACKMGASLYSCIPGRFVDEHGIRQSDELEVYADDELGCVLVFPAEVIDSE